MAKNNKPATYSGRLVADGFGNLLADEGEFQGHPVTWHDGSYVFVQAGEKSHNERHHRGELHEIRATTDDDGDDQPHHFGVLEDDPHYHEGAQNEFGQTTNTKLRFEADAISARVSGHTDAYEGYQEEE